MRTLSARVDAQWGLSSVVQSCESAAVTFVSPVPVPAVSPLLERFVAHVAWSRCVLSSGVTVKLFLAASKWELAFGPWFCPSQSEVLVEASCRVAKLLTTPPKITYTIPL